MNMNTNSKVNELSLIAMFAALVSVMGYVSIPIPFSPVPFTGQTLAVMLAGYILTPGQAGLSMLVFILMGAIGIPVFSGGAAGVAEMVGKRGGYLLGFVLGAMAISFMRKHLKGFFWGLAANITGGMLVVYTFGVLWLNHLTNMGLSKAVVLGAAMFIPTDLLKAVIAAVIGERLNNYLRSR